jgi:hypothetical protein
MIKQQRRWEDLTGSQRVLVAVGGLIQLSLMLAAQVDMWRRDPAEIRGSRWIWTFVVLINFVGPLAYFIVGRHKSETTSG